MRLTATLAVLVVVAAMEKGVAAQLAVGPDGVSTPPINVLALFRLVREVLSHVMSDTSPQPELKEKTSGADGNRTQYQRDTLQNLLDEVESKCSAGEACWAALKEKPMLLNTTPLLTGKWHLAYLAFIITTSIIILIISIPYIVTGEPYYRSYATHLPLPDQQDSLLLLTWLLGEASGDQSCLERAVCLTPDRSARYLAVPSTLANLFPSWVPYRYQEQLSRLGEVTDNGLNHSCHKYSCPVLPDL